MKASKKYSASRGRERVCDGASIVVGSCGTVRKFWLEKESTATAASAAARRARFFPGQPAAPHKDGPQKSPGIAAERVAALFANTRKVQPCKAATAERVAAQTRKVQPRRAATARQSPPHDTRTAHAYAMFWRRDEPPSPPPVRAKPRPPSPLVATPVPQGLGEAGLSAWLGPERAPPLPLPPIAAGDEADDAAYRGGVEISARDDARVGWFLRRRTAGVALGPTPNERDLKRRYASWLAAAPLPPRWVATERDFLARVKRECSTELAAAPPFPEAYGDRRLLRFLRQHKNADRAVVAVKKYLVWRRREKLDDVRRDIAGGNTDMRSWPHGEFWAARVRLLPCAESMFDVKGNALCVEQYAHWPAHRLRDCSAEMYGGRGLIQSGQRCHRGCRVDRPWRRRRAAETRSRPGAAPQVHQVRDVRARAQVHGA